MTPVQGLLEEGAGRLAAAVAIAGERRDADDLTLLHLRLG